MAPFNDGDIVYLGGVEVTQGTLTGYAGDSLSHVVTYDTVNFDDLAAYNPATPTLVTVPAGVTKMRLFFKMFCNQQTNASGIDGTFRCLPNVNGAAPVPSLGLTGFVPAGNTLAAQHILQLSSFNQLKPCTPGDQWTLLVTNTTGQILQANGISIGFEWYA